METKITCPVCRSQNCFEQEMESLKSYLCVGCGYTSNSLYTKDSKELKQMLTTTAELIRNLEFYDEERKLFWYPTVIRVADKGMIFPEGDENDYHWAFAPVVEIPKEEQEKYPIPGADGELYESRLAVEQRQTFDKNDFIGACNAIGIVVEKTE